MTRYARVDGRGRVELSPGHATAAKRRRIEEIAHVLGYRLLAIQNLGRAGSRRASHWGASSMTSSPRCARDSPQKT
ncbi:hypothetical protein ACH40F_58460 [Streptomyces sp. NPDC020794]|uniref:hypothetical protein n=1 Tax=unclassified Streptomyces TaxID=2593676 RepID=UPI0036E92EB7